MLIVRSQLFRCDTISKLCFISWTLCLFYKIKIQSSASSKVLPTIDVSGKNPDGLGLSVQIFTRSNPSDLK